MPLKINEISTMPQMQEAIDGWEVDMIVNKKRQTMVNGDVVYKDMYIKLRGVWQPFKPEDLLNKEEYARSWSWFYVHVKTTYPELTIGQQIIMRGKTYKVMGIRDYSLNSYRLYEVILDFQ